MDLNWCPVCEQHIPLAWETSLYCSDRCKQADAMASSAQHGLNGSFPAQMQSFSRQRNSGSYSPLSSPTLVGVKISSSASSVYPSPPTSPMSNYLYNKTSSGRISPPAFSLGAANTDLLEFRRKSTVSMMTSTMLSSAKKGFF
ncbi:hypothetical protein BGZ52_001613 [Haplosporangium bisporale]|nr:hypothetical protein BGZ52_001613 [Haplosporangium bisporale]